MAAPTADDRVQFGGYSRVCPPAYSKLPSCNKTETRQRPLCRTAAVAEAGAYTSFLGVKDCSDSTVWYGTIQSTEYRAGQVTTIVRNCGGIKCGETTFV